MNSFEQQDVLFKHTDNLSEAVDKNAPNWSANTIYFVEDNVNKQGIIFLNGIAYTPTGQKSTEIIGYTFKNVASGNYITRNVFPCNISGVSVDTLLTSPDLTLETEIMTFSNGNNFAGTTTHTKINNVIATTINQYFNYLGGRNPHFTVWPSSPQQGFYCIHAVDDYGSTDFIQDTYYMWKHNPSGCGVLTESTVDGKTVLDLIKSGNDGNQSFETPDGFIWGVDKEERKKMQWVIRPVYGTKTQWRPRGNYNQQESYEEGDVVTYKNSLYLCKTGYNASDVSFLNPDDKNAANYWIEVFKAEKSSYRGEYKYELDGRYDVNDVVYVGSSIYMCTRTFYMEDEEISRPSSKVYWAEILKFPSPKFSLQYRGEYSIGDAGNMTSYNKNDIVTHNGSQFICLKDYTTPQEALSGSSYIPSLNKVAWNSSDSTDYPYLGTFNNRLRIVYTINDIVLSGGRLYKCIEGYIGNVDSRALPEDDPVRWSPIPDCVYLSESAAASLTDANIISLKNTYSLYRKIDSSLDSRGYPCHNIYKCTGVASRLFNPYSSPANMIASNLPYWELFAITDVYEDVEVTYAVLKELVDNKKLKTDVRYILTDYNNVSTDSAYNGGHNFYIILTAQSDSVLNSKCSFMLDPNRSDYFKSSYLENWSGEYILNNDNLVHIEGCNGTIILLVDENNNKCNYDFKNAKIGEKGGSYTFERLINLSTSVDASVANDNYVKNNTCLTYGMSKIVIYEDRDTIENCYFNLYPHNLNIYDDSTPIIGHKDPVIILNGFNAYNVNISNISNCHVMCDGIKIIGGVSSESTLMDVNINNIYSEYLGYNTYTTIDLHRPLAYEWRYAGSDDEVLSNINLNNNTLVSNSNYPIHANICHSGVNISNSTIGLLNDTKKIYLHNNIINSSLSISNNVMDMLLDCDIHSSNIRMEFNTSSTRSMLPSIMRLSLNSNNSSIYSRNAGSSYLNTTFNFAFDQDDEDKVVDLNMIFDHCDIHNPLYINLDNDYNLNKLTYRFDPSLKFLYDADPDKNIILPSEEGFTAYPFDTIGVYIFSDALGNPIIINNSEFECGIPTKYKNDIELNKYIGANENAKEILTDFYTKWFDAYTDKYLILDNNISVDDIPEDKVYRLGKINTSDTAFKNRDIIESYSILGDHDPSEIGSGEIKIGTTENLENPRLNQSSVFKFMFNTDVAEGGVNSTDIYANVSDILNALTTLYKSPTYRMGLRSGINLNPITDGYIYQFTNAICETDKIIDSYRSYNISAFKNGPLISLKDACNRIIDRHNSLKIACAVYDDTTQKYIMHSDPLTIENLS